MAGILHLYFTVTEVVKNLLIEHKTQGFLRRSGVTVQLRCKLRLVLGDGREMQEGYVHFVKGFR